MDALIPRESKWQFFRGRCGVRCGAESSLQRQRGEKRRDLIEMCIVRSFVSTYRVLQRETSKRNEEATLLPFGIHFCRSRFKLDRLEPGLAKVFISRSDEVLPKQTHEIDERGYSSSDLLSSNPNNSISREFAIRPIPGEITRA